LKNKKMFPYYIVRFKQYEGNGRKAVQNEFPYYIVRFKQRMRCPSCMGGMKFPYYIVRFKLELELRTSAPQEESFHTT